MLHPYSQQEVKEKRIKLKYVPTTEMVADGLTKPLGGPKTVEMLGKIGMKMKHQNLTNEKILVDIEGLDAASGGVLK